MTRWTVGRVRWPAPSGVLFDLVWNGDSSANSITAFIGDFDPGTSAGELLVSMCYWSSDGGAVYDTDPGDGFGAAENGWTNLLADDWNGATENVVLDAVVTDGGQGLFHGWEVDDVYTLTASVRVRGTGHSVEGTYIDEAPLASTFSDTISTGGDYVLLFVVSDAGVLDPTGSPLRLNGGEEIMAGGTEMDVFVYEGGNQVIELDSGGGTNILYVSAVAISI